MDEILPGQFEVEILRASEYVEKYNKYQDIKELQDLSSDSKTAMGSFFQALEHADIEMGQFQLAELADRFSEQMNVFDMPYMFDNHEHVNRVVEGDIGAELQAGTARGAASRGPAGGGAAVCAGPRGAPAPRTTPGPPSPPPASACADPRAPCAQPPPRAAPEQLPPARAVAMGRWG